MFCAWLAVAYFGREKISLLPCAALFSDFSESKSGKILCVWRIFACLWLKQIIHFHLQVYSPTFRNRKSRKRFSPLKRRSESAASSPHIKLSSVKLSRTSEILNLRSQMLRTARWGWYLSKICLSQL